MHRRGPRPWLGLTSTDNAAKGPHADYSHVVPDGRRKRACIACQGRMRLTAYMPRPTVREILETPWMALEQAQRGIVLRRGTPDAAGTTAPDAARVQRPESLQAETEAAILPSTAHW